ncbi:DUF4250 domain-containing protein [uncultured Clostridium sp.]|uniref:DUF4250 domain-containing protein n=1 Tax=uncultured Clostridium sp. TaxID=59620 RepID=UPI0026020172|nr:DUF4250 domain-containing protein [uncultured Clostridium sp.]
MDIQNMDVNILVSIINLKLRDYYKDLDTLCEDMDLNEEELKVKLKEGGFDYLKEGNCFR